MESDGKSVLSVRVGVKHPLPLSVGGNLLAAGVRAGEGRVALFSPRLIEI
jgi:hypothetical protein